MLDVGSNNVLAVGDYETKSGGIYTEKRHDLEDHPQLKPPVLNNPLSAAG